MPTDEQTAYSLEQTSTLIKSQQIPNPQIMESLSHLIPIKIKKRIIEDASLHPLANLDYILGPVHGPAINPEILIQNPRVCILCGVDFKSLSGLHAHLTYHKHILGELEPKLNLPMYDCRSCRNRINCTVLMKHRCYIKQMADIKARRRFIDKNGSPLVCILCRGRIFPSRVHLVIHIIVAHSVNRDPYKCVFCHAQFISENLMIQEVHAFDCHAPVLFILTRKGIYKLLRNVKNNIVDVSVPFSCFYDSSKLERHQLTLLKGKSDHALTRNDTTVNTTQRNQLNSSWNHKICLRNFNCLAEYTTHLCCYHAASTLVNGFDNTNHKDPVEEVRRAQNRSLHVPGPTVSELLKRQNTSYYYNGNKTHNNEPQSPSTPTTTTRGQKSQIMKTSSFSTNRGIRMARTTSSSLKDVGRKGMKFRLDGYREQCRICLELFPDDYKFSNHVNSFHLPESKKDLNI
ncbi:unnamed protein product [Heterobilharzia americana]|nr:unnamed protein product [Heterobilharzia americana]